MRHSTLLLLSLSTALFGCGILTANVPGAGGGSSNGIQEATANDPAPIRNVSDSLKKYEEGLAAMEAGRAQAKEVERLASDRKHLESELYVALVSDEKLRTHPRLIAATNRDLGAMVDAGTFRSDLLYRLDGVTIRVPPLRERKQEIPALARALLEVACRPIGRATPTLDEGALALLTQHEWPGNVRELRRVTERIAALVRSDTVGQADLRTVLVSASAARDSKLPERLPGAVKAEVRVLERARIEEALRRAVGNQTQAAKLLGISRRTLIDRIERFDLPRPRK